MYSIHNFDFLDFNFSSQQRTLKWWEHILITLLRYGVFDTNSIYHLTLEWNNWWLWWLLFWLFTDFWTLFPFIWDIVLKRKTKRPKSKLVLKSYIVLFIIILAKPIKILYAICKPLWDPLNLHGLVRLLFRAAPWDILKQCSRDWLQFFVFLLGPLLVNVDDLNIRVKSVVIARLLILIVRVHF